MVTQKLSQKEVRITKDSIETELKSYKNQPYKCLFEYIWNAFDAGATEVHINFELPKRNMGQVTGIHIIDNGDGWDLEGDKNTNTFLSSSKAGESTKDKTLPHGKLGRGRYAFIWVADRLRVVSGGLQAILTNDTRYELGATTPVDTGTEIYFEDVSDEFSNIFKDRPSLSRELGQEFGWFLLQNSKRQIIMNAVPLNFDELVKTKTTITGSDFSTELQTLLAKRTLTVEIILWETKPTEWSSFYFLNTDRIEVSKRSTGLNKKQDHFYHSIYIISDIFSESVIKEIEDDTYTLAIDPNTQATQRAQRKLIQEIKQKILDIRRPVLKEQSDILVQSLKEDHIIPNLAEYDIYDEEAYAELLKTAYVVTPSVFVGKSDLERRFVCNTFAALLSTQDGNLIKKILEQLGELSEEEKKDLNAVLDRTKLSNIVKTMKEVHRRIETIDVLKVLLMEFKHETLEVKHLQKVLDENFWIFGEEFRLMSTTEGPLHKVLRRYAEEILGIASDAVKSNSKKELDLFLTKTERTGGVQKNIIIELKRPSVKLGEYKEYAQLKQYAECILKENICNGETQYWEFYLIGNDYDPGIEGLIRSSQNHGEKTRGLTHFDKDGRVKVYVRKWSDILEVEWGTKMSFLKDKLGAELHQTKSLSSPQKITEALTTEKP